MATRLCIERVGDDEYVMGESPNGSYVLYDDYKALENKYRDLVKMYTTLSKPTITPEYHELFFDPHD